MIFDCLGEYYGSQEQKIKKNFYLAIQYFDVEPWEETLNHIKVTIYGKEGTPYEDGKFILELKLPDNYPFNPPYDQLHTKIWHPDIDDSPPGIHQTCLAITNPDLVGVVDVNHNDYGGWTASKSILDVVIVGSKSFIWRFPFLTPQIQ